MNSIVERLAWQSCLGDECLDSILLLELVGQMNNPSSETLDRLLLNAVHYCTSRVIACILPLVSAISSDILEAAVNNTREVPLRMLLEDDRRLVDESTLADHVERCEHICSPRSKSNLALAYIQDFSCISIKSLTCLVRRQPMVFTGSYLSARTKLGARDYPGCEKVIEWISGSDRYSLTLRQVFCKRPTLAELFRWIEKKDWPTQTSESPSEYACLYYLVLVGNARGVMQLLQENGASSFVLEQSRRLLSGITL